MARTVTIDELQAELRSLLRHGLPVSDEGAGDVLPNLACVVTRATQPRSRLSRVRALDALLIELVSKLDEQPEGRGIATLFRFPGEAAGRTLTDRRHRVAQQLGFDPDHVRKHVEPKLLRQLALLFHDENDRHRTRSEDTEPAPEPSGPLPQLSTADYTLKEELASRLWARVWDMRAAYIRIGLLRDDQPRDEKLTIGRDALWHTARVIDVISEYIDRFGREVVSGEARYQAEALISLAAWPSVPADFGPEERNRLRLALQLAGHNAQSFANELAEDEAGKGLLQAWDNFVLGEIDQI